MARVPERQEEHRRDGGAERGVARRDRHGEARGRRRRVHRRASGGVNVLRRVLLLGDAYGVNAQGGRLRDGRACSFPRPSPTGLRLSGGPATARRMVLSRERPRRETSLRAPTPAAHQPRTTTVRLAIVSDIHGNLLALEAVLDDLRARGADLVVNLGDCATSPLWPRETLELLDTLALPTVRGNHDRWLAEMPRERMPRSAVFTRDALDDARRAALGALPATLRVADDVLAVHGTPASDTEYLLEERVGGRLALAGAAVVLERLGASRPGLVLCGHSHTQHVAQPAPGVLVLNPGSVGVPRHADDGDPSAEASSPHARYAIATRRATRSGGHWSVEMIALAYDWDGVAARARENGRDDFALAFLSGVATGG